MIDQLHTKRLLLAVNPDGGTLHYNHYTWNKIANILYMESPACMGYSYRSGASCQTSDDEVAEDNYVALKDFFMKYPEYKSHAFFLTGVSYCGVYLPMLTIKVQADPEINYQATAIGNGLLTAKWNDNSKLYFAYYHGLFGESDRVSSSYLRQNYDMTQYIQNILQAKGRILIYNGDVDAVCNFLGDEWFVDRLGLKLLSDRKPWFYRGEDGSKQIAGFAKTFPNLVFTTIRGSGHYVPTDKPRPALVMFEKFLKNEPF